jgi:hypothetical protein
MTNRRRSAATHTSTAGQQVHLHIAHWVVSDPSQSAQGTALWSVALQQALTAQLAGRAVPVNHLSAADQVAHAVLDQWGR